MLHRLYSAYQVIWNESGPRTRQGICGKNISEYMYPRIDLLVYMLQKLTLCGFLDLFIYWIYLATLIGSQNCIILASEFIYFTSIFTLMWF